MHKSQFKTGREVDRQELEQLARALGEQWSVETYVPTIANGRTLQLVFSCKRPLSPCLINALVNQVTGATKMLEATKTSKRGCMGTGLTLNFTQYDREDVRVVEEAIVGETRLIHLPSGVTGTFMGLDEEAFAADNLVLVLKVDEGWYFTADLLDGFEEAR